MQIQPLDPDVTVAVDDPHRAIELIGRLMGFSLAREVTAGIWTLGKFRSRSVFYARELTNDVRPFLASDTRAVCIYGRGGTDTSLGTVAKRCRALAELVVRKPHSELELDRNAINALVPPRTASLFRDQKGKGLLSRLPDWCRLMQDWYALVRAGKENFRPPPQKWIHWWFWECASPPVRAARYSLRTLMYDLHNLLTPKPGSDIEALCASFILLWVGVTDPKFVLKCSEKSLASMVKSAFAYNGKPPPEMLPEQLHGRTPYRAAC